ncbi:hypothetical protein CE91St44_20300 [Oscillospiraceae bacterium]|uniref:response regulator n=1 Tax=Allofournierella sp. TaxID=1940256 RepID=UPI0015A82972|nr:hypothetical protein CE91St44_20300 [Oscillospiraceae bacterium]
MRGRSFGKVVLLGGGNTELELLQRAFNGCGRTACTVFHNARAALHYLETVRVDVMVVDCLSIDMEIFNFLEQARKTPGSGACRIVVTGPSGYAENVRLALLSNGADYYMIKPYKANALFVSIESLAPGHRLAWTTPKDAAILHLLRRLGAPEKDAGYWYLASSLQYWLREWAGPPQLKAIYLEVGRYYGISPKGVESGIHRMAQVLAKQTGGARPHSNKTLLTELARDVCLELDQESREDYATNS